MSGLGIREIINLIRLRGNPRVINPRMDSDFRFGTDFSYGYRLSKHINGRFRGLLALGASIFRKNNSIKYLFYTGFCIMLVFPITDSWQVKKTWNDNEDRKFINWIIGNTRKEDIFWGGEGKQVFRQDGYPLGDKIVEMPSRIINRYPPLVESLEKNNTKYLLVDTQGIEKKTWPYNYVIYRDYREWVLANFTPTDFPNIWVRSKK
jgi:hypothetical protein